MYVAGFIIPCRFLVYSVQLHVLAEIGLYYLFLDTYEHLNWYMYIITKGKSIPIPIWLIWAGVCVYLQGVSEV